MERVIVTVVCKNRPLSRDLDVPADITAELLAQEVTSASGLGGRYEIYADSVRRVLFPQEPLSYAGVWDGAVLTLQPVGTGGPSAGNGEKTPLPPAPPPPEPTPDSPVLGWRPLNAPTSDMPEQTTPPRSGGFKWKRLDED